MLIRIANWMIKIMEILRMRSSGQSLVVLPVLSSVYGFKAGEGGQKTERQFARGFWGFDGFKAGEGGQFQPRILTDSHGFKALGCWGLRENE